MVTRVGGQLDHEIDRLLVQLHKVALESQIGHPGFVFVAVAPVVLEEQSQGAGGVEQGALDGYLLHLARLADLEGLGRWLLRGSAEVEGVVVEEDVEGLGGGGRGGCADQDAVQPDLAGEGHDDEQLLVGEGLELGLGVQALGPRLLADGAALVGFILVEGAQAAEVDLLVEEVLEGGDDVVVVGVVVAVGFGVLFVVAVAVVVVMRHGDGDGDCS